MPLVLGNSVDEVWDKALDDLLNNPRYRVSPRGMDTSEIIGAVLFIKDARQNILVNTARDLNYKFMVAEWIWIMMGLDEVDVLAQYNKVMRDFSDDGKTLYGSYGKRLAPQWKHIVDKLQKDGYSRQSVTPIFTPMDNKANSKDIPCTVALQWLLREGELHCIATMRSSDIWLGLPYDIYAFSQMTNCLAGELGAEVGSLQMQLGSLHLYHVNMERAKEAFYEWQSYSLRSQRMIGMLDPRIETILRHPHGERDFFWSEKRNLQEILFTKVLQQPTKNAALGVLKNALNPGTP